MSMKSGILGFMATFKVLVAFGQSSALAAPITMVCDDGGERYKVSFDPSSRTLIVEVPDGWIHEKIAPRRFTIKNIAPADGGYKITASGGEAGPHVIVFTGASKKVEYTETSFGWIFSADTCK